MKNNENQLNDLFEKARTQQPETSFNETKGQFLNDLKAGKTSSFNQNIANSFKFKNWTIMLSTVSVIIVSSVLLLNSNIKTNRNKSENSFEEKAISADKSRVGDSLSIEDEIISVEMVTIEKNEIKTTTTTFNIEANDSIVVTSKVEKDTVRTVLFANQNYPKRNQLDTVYRFPKLTLEEIKANNKQKAKMLKQLAKLDKKKYAYIPSGTFTHKGKSVSIQAFYLGTTEVSNLEYRTFLFDLLINGRKEEFLIAKPDQEKWKFIMGNEQSSMQPMTDLYFSHPAYNDYPVNNISREGAQMYCKWITIECSKSKWIKKQTVLNDVRIPSDLEWIHAAYGGNINQPEFPWGTSSIKNNKDCYLANYKPIVNGDNILVNNAKFKQNKSNEGVLKGVVYVNNKVSTDTSLHNNFMIDGGFNTVKVTSYLPNDFGLYCMSGNIAEMVWRCPVKQNVGKNSDLIFCNRKDYIPGTKGGSWTSDLDEIKITGEDKFEGITEANANIGFRVVMTYRLKKDESQSYNNTKTIKITKNTDKVELENFKKIAEKEGVLLTYKAKYFNHKIRSLTINMDGDEIKDNCGAIYYRNTFFGAKDEYVLLGWNNEKSGSDKLFLEAP